MRGSIAVVVTCHELGRTLEEALLSVRGQTRSASEIVVIDDGSIDAFTRQVLAKLSGNGTRVVRTEQRGASAARNLGVGLTSAEYIVHLDADDVLERAYLEQAAARLDADQDLDFVSCAMRGFEGATYVWRPSPLSFVEAVSSGGVVHVSTMLRRRLWDRIGGYDEAFAGHEDLDFWITALELGFRGVVLDEPLLRYRVRPGSMYRQAIQPGRHVALMARFYEKHRTMVERHGPELLLGKETFILGQREHRKDLEVRRGALERELTALRTEIAGLVDTLQQRGISRVGWGDLRRLTPVSPEWGGDRGKPVNRYYIERFLEAHRKYIRGRVLGVKDSGYTDAFGSGVTRRDVLDNKTTNPQATLVADLARADAIPADLFDCVILTQVLNVNYDVRACLFHAHRMLKPGGALLCTVASLDRVSYEDRGADGDYWRFTEASMRELFAERFPLDAFEVTTYGNVLASAAFLYGLATEELKLEELDVHDPDFPLIVAVRAVKPDAVEPMSSPPRSPGTPAHAGRGGSGAILLYHRVASLSPDPHDLCVSPEVFRTHMEHLRRYYRPLGLDELADAARAGSVPARAVAVTLDDGYLDALTTASGILIDLGIPATFFVATGLQEGGREFLWDILTRLFLSGLAIPPALDLEVGGRRVRSATVTAEERTAAHSQLAELTYPMSSEDRGDVVRRLTAWSGLDPTPRASHRTLATRELQDLAARPGHRIGAHTTNHLALPRHPIEIQRLEIAGSKMRLEQVLDRPIRAFCYPYGAHGPDTVELVRTSGFTMAVTCEATAVRPGADPLLLPRLEVRACAAEDLGAQLDGLFAMPRVASRAPARS